MDEPPSSSGRPRGVLDDLQSVAPARPLLQRIAEGWRGLLHRRPEASLRESLEELIEDSEEAGEGAPTEEHVMLRKVLDFGETEVADVMVPRPDIVAVSADATLEEVARLISEAGHSRLPVYRDTLDEVTGMVHVRDLMRFWDRAAAFALDKVTRELLFVPPSMPIADLLRQMRSTKIHMALVVDEHGGTDGLVTIEDVVEEIVGEIEDEHDVSAEPLLAEHDDGRITADARVPVSALEALIGVDLLPEERDEDIDTVGGLVSDLAGRVPVRGETIRHPAGFAFEIVDADPRRVRRLCVRREQPHQPAAPAAAV